MNNKIYVILIIALILGLLLSTTTGSLVEGDESKTSPNIFCYSELQKLCDNERQSGLKSCNYCVGGTNQNPEKLKKAGCEEADIINWCKQKPIQLAPPGFVHKTFYNKIKSVFEDPNSDGVLISMLFTVGGINTMLDGSGSIIQKGTAESLYISTLSLCGEKCLKKCAGDCCEFGFIWDTPYTNLVDFLFSRDAFTTPIKKDCVSYGKNYCELANTIEPNRSSTGLDYLYNNLDQIYPELAVALQCNNNNKQKFIIDKTLNYQPEKFSDSCFKEIIKNKKSLYEYNEAVILNTVGDEGIEINKGLGLLDNLGKPKPVALVFLTNDDWGINKCRDSKMAFANFNTNLKTLNLNFAGDTLVIKLLTNSGIPGKKDTITFNGYTTLSEIQPPPPPPLPPPPPPPPQYECNSDNCCEGSTCGGRKSCQATEFPFCNSGRCCNIKKR